MYQCGIVRSLLATRPKRLFITANPRNISYWLALLLCKWLGIKAYSHGHGLFNKPCATMPHKLMYKCMVFLSTRYICYTDTAQESMRKLGANPQKLRVAHNSLHNDFALACHDKPPYATHILFVGRLRQGCGLDLLLAIFPALRQHFPNINLHVIGDGELASTYKNAAKDNSQIIFHGQLYNDKSIAEIANTCSLGVYPGNAGLSIVHLMSFSLPPVIHDNLYAHGPEASYVKNDQNGFMFRQGDANDLLRVLLSVFSHPEHLHHVAENAFNTYASLNNPDLADRLAAIFYESTE
jgi:glycosyltransferase involved in cell wall biosynthesis